MPAILSLLPFCPNHLCSAHGHKSIIPVVNGLSDHDAQLLSLYNSMSRVLKGQYYSKRQINRMSIENFNLKLSYETWDDVFTDGHVDNTFNNFLNTVTCKRAFNSSFSLSEKLSQLR
jgi:hypothetical protein